MNFEEEGLSFWTKTFKKNNCNDSLEPCIDAILSPSKNGGTSKQFSDYEKMALSALMDILVLERFFLAYIV